MMLQSTSDQNYVSLEFWFACLFLKSELKFLSRVEVRRTHAQNSFVEGVVLSVAYLEVTWTLKVQLSCVDNQL